MSANFGEARSSTKWRRAESIDKGYRLSFMVRIWGMRVCMCCMISMQGRNPCRVILILNGVNQTMEIMI